MRNGGIMAKKNKKPTMQEIAKSNPQVDEKIAADSLTLIANLRKNGVKPRGFNILRISESKLKMRNPAVYSLSK
jgi:hypothetical protein